MRGSVKLMVAAVLVVAAVGAALLWAVPVIKVGDIKVTGTHATDPGAVVHASGITEGQNLLRVDALGAARRVAALPWVKKATVKREFPQDVVIAVDERTPVLFVAYPDGDHLVDDTGTAFVIAPPPPGLVKVVGVRGDDPGTLKAVAAVAAGLDEATRAKIAEIDAPDSLSISLKTVDGRTIVWGSSDRLRAKLVALAVALGRDGKVVDISDPEQIAVRS